MSTSSTPPARRRRWLLPALLLLGWVVVGAAAGPLAGRSSEVQQNDNASFLPASAESTAALALAERFAGAKSLPALVVWERPGGLTPTDLTRIAAARERIAEVEELRGDVSPVVPSQDGAAAQVVAPLPAELEDSLGEVLDEVAAAAQVDGLTAVVAGPGTFVAELSKAFQGVDGRLLVATASVVLVILLVVYRSPVFVPVLLAAGLALTTAQAATYLLARAGILTLNGQSAGILLVLVFGAGTDYALLLISRYREELRRHEHAGTAVHRALRAALPAVLASGLTVVLGLLCLLLSDLESNRSLGPVAAVGILCATASMLTFLPALLVVLGRRWFWPFAPTLGSPPAEERGTWGRLAGAVARRDRRTWVATTAALLGLCALLPMLDTDGIGTEDTFTTANAYTRGQEVLERHFPSGSGSPVQVYAPAEEAERVLRLVQADPGVAQADLTTAPPGPGAPAPPPVEVDGTVEVQGLLADRADSPAAEATVARLRAALDEVSRDVLVGGTTAVEVDVQRESERDNRVIIPAVLLVILVVLAVLLRSLLAPVLLLATVVLSYAATLGACGFVFREVFGFAGADPSFPLFAFVFLVALGIDYNIFLMTRVREEAQRLGTREGTRRGLAVTGGVITSAGVVLAATFGVLAVLPLVFLAEIGFAVAFGVLLDTLVVRSLLVPALVHDLGERVWWPGRLAAVRPADATGPPAAVSSAPVP